MTIAEFIVKYGITAETVQADGNPNIDAQEWGPGAQHWRVTLWRRDGERMEVTFTQGSGHTTVPTAADVLECLASDADVINHDTFESWAEDFGLDTDSRTAEQTYKACRTQTESLRRFLGEGTFEELLLDVEQD